VIFLGAHSEFGIALWNNVTDLHAPEFTRNGGVLWGQFLGLE